VELIARSLELKIWFSLLCGALWETMAHGQGPGVLQAHTGLSPAPTPILAVYASSILFGIPHD